MKKLFSILLFMAVVACLLLLPTGAHAASVNDLTYTIDGGEVTITGCNTSAVGELVIPETIEGYPVTSIDIEAFRDCINLTSVTIPDSVTHIGRSAFSFCRSLTSVTIPDSVTSIGYYAFAYCTGLTSVTIPNSVTSIDGLAFAHCTGLTSVIIPDSVTSIGDQVFSNCTGLTSVTIPGSVTSIGQMVFRDCINLTSVTIGKGVTSIGDYMFQGCTGLTSITIPDSVTSIGYLAFRDCINLTSVTIPNSVTSIDDQAFYHCTGLTSVTIPNSVTRIGGNAFSGCTGLTSVTIPDSVTRIDKYVFYGCTGLTSVTIPDSVTSIGDYAFAYCTGLTSVTIPDRVTSIGQNAFRECTRLTNVTIGKGVTSIGERAFVECYKLRHVLYTGTQEQWNAITIASKNDYILQATRHYNCTGDELTENGCSICNCTHNWNSGAVTQQPTCKDEGVKTYTCTACNAIKTESVDKLTTHTYGNCTKVNDTAHKHSCSVCQKEETAAHTWNGGVVTKAATCKEAGVKTYTCTGCNATKTETIAKLTTHTYDHNCDTECNVCGLTRTITHNYKTTWSKDGTNHWHECSVCKDKKDLATHNPGAAATETTAQTCTTCGYVIQAALGHKHNYADVWTTDENGHWYTCSGCEEKESYAEHTPGPAATATTNQTCTICGYILKEATGETEPATQPTEPSGTEAIQPESTPVTPTEPTTTPVVPTEPAGGREPSTDPTMWIIVAVAIVVLGGGAAGIIIWKKKH